MDKAEGFEVTEYGEDDGGYAAFAAIKQIVADLVKKNPAYGITSRFENGRFVLQYTCYEAGLNVPLKIRSVEEQADQVFKETLKFLKKEMKAKTKKSYSFKELKDRASYNVQKVSLNDRYTYLAWRVYELG